MWAGKIVPAKVPALWKMLHETQGKPIGYHPDLIFGRDDLKKLAIESGNERPKFLFPEEEHPASPQSVGETAHKRTTLAIWKMIPIVEAEIGAPHHITRWLTTSRKKRLARNLPGRSMTTSKTHISRRKRFSIGRTGTGIVKTRRSRVCPATAAH